MNFEYLQFHLEQDLVCLSSKLTINRHTTNTLQCFQSYHFQANLHLGNSLDVTTFLDFQPMNSWFMLTKQ